MTAPRLSAAELDAAADALADTGPPLAPLPTATVLAHLAHEVHALSLDLWPLRDSIEHLEPHPEHALGELPRCAAHLAAATASVEAIAAMLGIALPPEPVNLDGC